MCLNFLAYMAMLEQGMSLRLSVTENLNAPLFEKKGNWDFFSLHRVSTGCGLLEKT